MVADATGGRKRTTADEDAETRSTDRPPSPEQEIQRDIAAALAAAKSASPGRYGPPAATAKIRPFDLAEGLALSSADEDPSSRDDDRPLRDDDAPFVPPEVEVLATAHVTTPPEIAHVVPRSPSPATAVDRATSHESRSTAAAAGSDVHDAREPARRSYAAVVALALVIGGVLGAYAFVYANR